MRDNLADPGTDVDTGTAGYQTRVPVVRWDPVPGAASYEVQIADWNSGTSTCAWATADYLKKTSIPEWTPLGGAGGNPVVWQGTLAQDTIPIAPGTFFLRVRARRVREVYNLEVWGYYN